MLLALLLAVLFPSRPVALEDIPHALRRHVDGADFAAYVRSLERRTGERLRDGEWDHLVFYILQSATFTRLPRIEPALSARDFTEAGAQVPPPVLARMRDFLAALERPAADGRLRLFRGMHPRMDDLTREYARAMRLLYLKEFSADNERFYRARGHSTDTQLEANFAVHTGLAILKGIHPGLRLDRVLIIGPGLDFAPRTELVDAFPPQSYQPFALADSLLALGLSDPGRLHIHCVDINPRVVSWLHALPKTLRLLTTAAGSAEYREWFENFGRRIGTTAAAPPAARLVRLNPALARCITADRFDIATARYDPSPKFDLVLATNVLPYFETRELTLALCNVRSMLRTGGYFLHNEPRPELEAISRQLGMPPVQGRTVLLSAGHRRPLYDVVAIHQAVETATP